MVDYEKTYGELKDIYLPYRLSNLFRALLLVVYVTDNLNGEAHQEIIYPFFGASYATNYENKMFSLHRYCWCEKDTCEYCAGNKPLFIHKPSGFAMSWYKYWDRDAKANRNDLEEIEKIFVDCINSVYEEDE